MTDWKALFEKYPQAGLFCTENLYLLFKDRLMDEIIVRTGCYGEEMELENKE